MTNGKTMASKNRGRFTMAENNNLDYEQTLIYGRYKRELENFAKFHAKKIRRESKDQLSEFRGPSKFRKFLSRCIEIRDFVFQKIGEDWIFLAILGVIMALLSFCMDFIIEICQQAKLILHEYLAFSVVLQYFAWVIFSILFILFAAGFTHLVAPQAIGSGIPEMKTILRGVVLKEYLKFKTLIAKIVGLVSSIGSTLPIGKEGPFVHIASIVATLLGKLQTFRGIYENESRRSEMLAAACAVGVAGTFAAPIGGVLFSIEVTATYFAVRNYWRGFFSAVCGALVFRLLSIWFHDEETLTALFKTTFRIEFPFDPLELFIFSAVGVACGFGGALFILLHRKIILFTRKHKKLSRFLQKNRFIYPGLVALVISSLTFPPGLGQFIAGELTHRQAINELFSNITWTHGQADNMHDNEVISHWKHEHTNIYINLVIFIIMNFWMGALANTLPVPAGVFVPVFTVGAAFGRLIGESMATWFPTGIRTGDVVHKIVPGGYAVVGAAALSGSVTRTISTAVIVFELTGQINHVLPAVIAVLISNAIANFFQPSFYDSIINLKRLPYLPDIVSARKKAWNVYVDDILVKDIRFVSFIASYKELQELLKSSNFRSYPLVDSKESMILLGSVHRYELERLLWMQINHDRKIVYPHPEHDSSPESDVEMGMSRISSAESVASSAGTPVLNSRFKVSKVKEKKKKKKPDNLPVPPIRFHIGNDEDAMIPMQDMSSNQQEHLPSQDSHFLQVPTASNSYADDESHQDTYHGPRALRSILKKSPSEDTLKRRASTGNMEEEFANYHRQKAPRGSIVEDIPYFVKKTSFPNIHRHHHVKLPPEPIKIKNLSPEEQENWEEEQLQQPVEWDGVQIDPAPFQLVERTSLYKVHSLFSLLGLSHAYVTNTGRLVGVVGLKQLRNAIQGHLDGQPIGKVDSDQEGEFDDPAHLEVEKPPRHFAADHKNNNKL